MGTSQSLFRLLYGPVYLSIVNLGKLFNGDALSDDLVL